MYKFYSYLGQITFKIGRPFLRLYLKRTTRAYVLMFHGRKVLVIKNWLGRGKWALPGGGIHKYEDAKTATIREVNEELNIKLRSSQLKLIKKGRWQTDKLGYSYYIFKTNYYSNDVRLKRHEITSAKWINMDKLTKQNTSYEILSAISEL